VVVEYSLALNIALSFGGLDTPAPVEVLRVYAHYRLPIFPHIVVGWDWLLGVRIQKRTFLLLSNHNLAKTLLKMSVQKVLIFCIGPVVFSFKLFDPLLVLLLSLNQA